MLLLPSYCCWYAMTMDAMEQRKHSEFLEFECSAHFMNMRHSETLTNDREREREPYGLKTESSIADLSHVHTKLTNNSTASESVDRCQNEPITESIHYWIEWFVCMSQNNFRKLLCARRRYTWASEREGVLLRRTWIDWSDEFEWIRLVTI